jgi:sugar lactone lactonase YvrE
MKLTTIRPALSSPATLAFAADAVGAATTSFLSLARGGLLLAIVAFGTAATARGAAGDLYVAQRNILRITPAGGVTEFAQAFSPACVRFDRAGNLYVVEHGAFAPEGKIARITPAGERSVFINAQGSWFPNSLALDSAGNVYVAANSNFTVRQFNSAGVFVGIRATLPAKIFELACDKRTGDLFASAGSSVYRIAPNGTVTIVGTPATPPRGVAVDDAGNVYVSTEGGQILKYTGGTSSPTTLISGVSEIFNLAVDRARNVYVSSSNGTFQNGEALLYKVSPAGSMSTVASTPRKEGDFRGVDFEPPRGKSLNISTRLQVQTGDNALIGGFIVTGSAPKKVIIRAIGPSLAGAGVQGALQDPTLELYNSTGAFVNGNDNWKTTQQAAIQNTGIPPSDDREAALVITLGVGSYTVVVRGQNDTSGVGLVEVYDLDENADSQLANISTRGRVGANDNFMIGGFIVSGNGARVIIRGLGPSLTAAGVSGASGDPVVTLVNANGEWIKFNDDWGDNQRDVIQGTGLAPAHSLEAAMVMDLPNGSYTAVVRSASPATSGTALVEIYNVP